MATDATMASVCTNFEELSAESRITGKYGQSYISVWNCCFFLKKFMNNFYAISAISNVSEEGVDKIQFHITWFSSTFFGRHGGCSSSEKAKETEHTRCLSCPPMLQRKFTSCPDSARCRTHETNSMLPQYCTNGGAQRWNSTSWQHCHNIAPI